MGGLRRWLVKYGAWGLVATLALVILVLLLRDVDLLPMADVLKEYAPVAAAAVALISLIVLMMTSWNTWTATRKQATLEAWSAWSDRTAADRKLLTDTLGAHALSTEQGAALADRAKTLHDLRGEEVVGDEREKIVHALAQVLNGLERLAVGVEVGIYRRRVLVHVGGTIIKRSYERFEPYIEHKRSLPDKSRRQERVYEALEGLARQIRFDEVDAQRIKSLGRQQ